MRYYENKGKICSEPDCNNLARVKGLCSICYKKEKIKKSELGSNSAGGKEGK